METLINNPEVGYIAGENGRLQFERSLNWQNEAQKMLAVYSSYAEGDPQAAECSNCRTSRMSNSHVNSGSREQTRRAEAMLSYPFCPSSVMANCVYINQLCEHRGNHEPISQPNCNGGEFTSWVDLIYSVAMAGFIA